MTEVDRSAILFELSMSERLLKNGSDQEAWTALFGYNTECPTIYKAYAHEAVEPCIHCPFNEPADVPVCLVHDLGRLAQHRAAVMHMLVRFIADCKVALGES